MAIRGRRVGYEAPEETFGYELRVLGAVIRQALEDMQQGDSEAEAWLAEAIGLDRYERWGLARQFARGRGWRVPSIALRSAQDDREGGDDA